MIIDGRNFTPPGSYIPAGDSGVVYLMIGTPIDIETAFPAVDYPNCKARDNVANVDLTSVAGAWVPDDVSAALGYTPEDTANKTTVFDGVSQISDDMYPTSKLVYDSLLYFVGLIAVTTKIGFTLPVVPNDGLIVTGLQKYAFRVPHDFVLESVTANLQDATGSVAIIEIDVLSNAVSILDTHLTIPIADKTSTIQVLATELPMVTDEEITVDVIVSGTGAKGLSITLVGFHPV